MKYLSYRAAIVMLAVTCGMLPTEGRGSIKYKLLNFFFDGVPAPGARPPAAPVSGDEDGGGQGSAAPAHAVVPEPVDQMKSVHPPFLDGDCAKCHGLDSPQALTAPLPSLCFQCHSNFLEKTKVKHQALELGQCTTCHAPHESPNKKLLVRLGRSMCLECHDDPANATLAADAPVVQDKPVAKETALSKETAVSKGKPVAKAPLADDLARIANDIPLIANDIPTPVPPVAKGKAQVKGKVVHPPVEGDCLVCHDPHGSDNKGLLKKPLLDTCVSCHKDSIKAVKFKHDPVGNGECMSCHAPHQSDNKGLLIKPVSKVCLECHDNPAATGKVKHQPVEDGCVDCHSPHGSDNKAMLKKPMAATCFECHEDFLKGAKFKHDPAGNGECMSCHAAHASDNNALLIKPGSKMCFECHDEADIKNGKVHQRFPDRDCVSCHDPHAGSDEKFLKPGILKLTAESETKAPPSQ